MKIFWSWQSDSPQRTGRHFVRQALERAVEKLADHPDLEADERPEVDSDTANVSGSPPIAQTILEKIDACAVFVADVTPVGVTPGGKKLPNPNVMIELGYAMAQVKHRRIVLVMNNREGAALSALPFDLRHWRAPLTYSLKKDADDAAVAAELESFADHLAAALQSALAYALEQAGGGPPAPPAPRASEAHDAAIWSGAYPDIGATDFGQEFRLPVVAGPKLYCRLIPAGPFAATREDMLKVYDNRRGVVPMGDTDRLWAGHNGEGVLTWSQDNHKSLLSATQWFQDTGEIWAVWPNAWISEGGRVTFTADYNAKALEAFLAHHFKTLEHFGARKPWRVIVGTAGLAGTHLPIGRRGGFRGLADPAPEDRARVRGLHSEARDIAYALFRKIYDSYGAPNLSPEGYAALLQ